MIRVELRNWRFMWKEGTFKEENIISANLKQRISRGENKKAGSKDGMGAGGRRRHNRLQFEAIACLSAGFRDTSPKLPYSFSTYL